MMLFKRSPTSLLLPLASLWLASACTGPGVHPLPAADLLAVTEAKPIPTDDIATSQKAADLYSATVESWADRISAAGGRLCRFTERTSKLPFQCPAVH